jgi:hypothetical protein
MNRNRFNSTSVKKISLSADSILNQNKVEALEELLLFISPSDLRESILALPFNSLKNLEKEVMTVNFHSNMEDLQFFLQFLAKLDKE